MLILATNAHGAGWSTWQDNPKIARFMAKHPVVIEAVQKRRGKIGNDKTDCLFEHDPAIVKMLDEIKENWGEIHVCVLGCRNLQVYDVKSPIRIRDRDGYEYFEILDDSGVLVW